MTRYAKHALCALYKYSGALHAQERLAYWAGRRFGVILLLHRVTDEIPWDGITVDTRYFRALCALLRDRYHVLPLSELCNRLRDGGPLPPRTVALTFDDCYRDNLAAAHVLAEHGLPACFFLPTRYVGTDHVFDWDKSLKRLANLAWDDVQKITQLGHEIGSHTMTHADLGVIGPDEARHELVASRRELQERLGRAVRWFAYPYGFRGNFKPEYLPLVHEAGYEACFAAYSGLVAPAQWGQILPRVAVPAFRSLLALEMYLSGCFDWFHRLKRKAGLIA
jgi:peptidoglycan/xylan/chitin deacetylase (PgdA/CDA1 family)